ncbi:MAG: hypothetical protein ISR84_04600 [Kiritimatiellales bacterium]|nr:hypothetical protein [Kiritimatiellales bacterium]
MMISRHWKKRFQTLEKRNAGFPMIGNVIAAVLLAGSLAAVAQDAAPVAVEKTPAEKLIEQARAEQTAGTPKQAIQTVARVLILEQVEKETLAQCELLMAELYLEQGMTNAASVTAGQIQVLHEGSEVAKKADALKLKIDELKKAEELK